MWITVVLLNPQVELISHKLLMDWPFAPLPTLSPLIELHTVDNMRLLIEIDTNKLPCSRVTVWTVVSRLQCVVGKH